MALITTVAGSYLGVYIGRNAYDPNDYLVVTPNEVHQVGITREGYRLSWVIHEYEWKNSVSFGRSTIENIYLGADWFMSFHAREYSAGGPTRMAWPYGTRIAAPFGGNPVNVTPVFPVAMGFPGSRQAEFSGALLLTRANAATPSVGPAVFFAPFVGITGGSDFSFDSTNRELSLRLRLFPFQFPYELDSDTRTHDQIWFWTA